MIFSNKSNIPIQKQRSLICILRNLLWLAKDVEMLSISGARKPSEPI